MTIYMFGIMEGLTTKKQIHKHAKNYWNSLFPKLPSYVAFVQRINKLGDAFIGMVEIQATDNLRFGYAYDMPFTPLKYFTRGSHELMLRYEFGSFKTKIKSTRYF